MDESYQISQVYIRKNKCYIMWILWLLHCKNIQLGYNYFLNTSTRKIKHNLFWFHNIHRFPPKDIILFEPLLGTK